MEPRERVQAALAHGQPDRIPFDLGSTNLTGIHERAYRALRRHLGLGAGQQVVYNVSGQLALVEDDIVERLAVDARMVAPNPPSGFRPAFAQSDGYVVYHDEFGIGRRMPVDGGLYYDMCEHPLAGELTADRIDRFPWPDGADPARTAGMAERARHIAEVERRAVVVSDMTGGLLEVYAWLRGFEAFYQDLVDAPDLVGAALDHIVDMKLAYWEQALAQVGPYIDVAVQADDIAGQNGMLFSPKTYRRLLKPRQRRVFDYLHSHSRAKVFYHSCGSVRPVIRDLIEAGIDILNPIQVSAAAMDTAELKAEYGRDIVFWGGGVDTQHVLDKGTPGDVRAEVRRRIGDLAPGGGFVFATVHCIQPNVPPENVMAMWETLQEEGWERKG